jgi:hypothetical protein
VSCLIKCCEEVVFVSLSDTSSGHRLSDSPTATARVAEKPPGECERRISRWFPISFAGCPAKTLFPVTICRRRRASPGRSVRAAIALCLTSRAPASRSSFHRGLWTMIREASRPLTAIGAAGLAGQRSMNLTCQFLNNSKVAVARQPSGSELE